ncbi:hypothetical protein RvY_03136 [Ramazzottius varieornatus]|uniref:Uncharacterized protein n=1 Tax=Ramazzottius varieornatus TaxID=947166 RepID=A0A1D1USR9_RAMVA|nr:hypothetical protein RvY_03136 [Ramazzottius varieornatus]
MRKAGSSSEGSSSSDQVVNESADLDITAEIPNSASEDEIVQQDIDLQAAVRQAENNGQRHPLQYYGTSPN